MKNYAQLDVKLERMEAKLAETKEASNRNKGPVNDTLQIVIPMMEEQLELMRDILEETR